MLYQLFIGLVTVFAFSTHAEIQVHPQGSALIEPATPDSFGSPMGVTVSDSGQIGVISYEQNSVVAKLYSAQGMNLICQVNLGTHLSPFFRIARTEIKGGTWAVLTRTAAGNQMLPRLFKLNSNCTIAWQHTFQSPHLSSSNFRLALKVGENGAVVGIAQAIQGNQRDPEVVVRSSSGQLVFGQNVAFPSTSNMERAAVSRDLSLVFLKAATNYIYIHPYTGQIESGFGGVPASQSVALSDDGRYSAIANQGSVAIVDVQNAQLVSTFSPEDPSSLPKDLTFFGEHLVFAQFDGWRDPDTNYSHSFFARLSKRNIFADLQWQDLKGRRVLNPGNSSQNHTIRKIATSSESRMIAVGHAGIAAHPTYPTLRIYHEDRSLPLVEISIESGKSANDVAVSPSGQYLAVLSGPAAGGQSIHKVHGYRITGDPSFELDALPAHGLEASADLTTGVELTWSATNGRGAKVFRRQEFGFSDINPPQPHEQIGIVRGRRANFLDTTAQTDVLYYYCVKHYRRNSAGQFEFTQCAQDSGRRIAPLTVLPPVNLTATQHQQYRIDVTWDLPQGSDNQNWQFFYTANPSLPGCSDQAERIELGWWSVHQALISQVQQNVNYYISMRARAVNGGGQEFLSACSPTVVGRMNSP